MNIIWLIEKNIRSVVLEKLEDLEKYIIEDIEDKIIFILINTNNY
jgi:hypothetical protein